ncbi:hypothetical protein ACFCZ5_28265 [Streptomyces microflavus]|uniref:hypothetical protein n=1 Tax=Streptomyces microflavus TaxID=1919 RepID=UPI0035DD4BB4
MIMIALLLPVVLVLVLFGLDVLESLLSSPPRHTGRSQTEAEEFLAPEGQRLVRSPVRRQRLFPA